MYLTRVSAALVRYVWRLLLSVYLGPVIRKYGKDVVLKMDSGPSCWIECSTAKGYFPHLVRDVGGIEPKEIIKDWRFFDEEAKGKLHDLLLKLSRIQVKYLKNRRKYTPGLVDDFVYEM